MVLRPKNATLVVIGDVGRSPRMCYHAKSLADKNYQVQIVGYLDSKPDLMISDHPNIRFVDLWPVPATINDMKSRYSKFSMILKFFWIFISLLYALVARVKWPLLILMQNPPGVPAMLVCWLAARIYRAQFVIDWHNYTYSMLCQSHGISDSELQVSRAASSRPTQSRSLIDEASPGGTPAGDARRRHLTKQERSAQSAAHAANKKRKSISDKKPSYLMRRFVEGTHYWEGFFGRRADLNICVTHAMRQHMLDEWNVHSATVYDKPPAWKYQSLDIEQRHQLFLRFSQLGGLFSAFASSDEKPLAETSEVTRFSYRDSEGVVHLRSDRPLLLISSTSWTEDEDFGYLLDALRDFDNVARLSSRANPATRLPLILCVITGKGPMKDFYLGRIEKARMQNVAVITPWLEAEDYPLLLGSADIGVSLHTSTSGLDLPMKAVDMFGCGLPVIAKRFPCIGELVMDGHNGRLFDTSSELFNILKSLVCGFPAYSTQLKTLTTNVLSDYRISWDENWDACVWPLIKVFGAPPHDELARRRRYAVTREDVMKKQATEKVDEEKGKMSEAEVSRMNSEEDNEAGRLRGDNIGADPDPAVMQCADEKAGDLANCGGDEVSDDSSLDTFDASDIEEGRFLEQSRNSDQINVTVAESCVSYFGLNEGSP